jgi:adenylate cyclase
MRSFLASRLPSGWPSGSPPRGLRPFAGLTLGHLAIGLVAVGLVLWAQWWAAPPGPGPAPPGISRWGDESLRDRLLQLQVSSQPDPRVLVVDIDEPSLAALGPWPWPRERIADLVEKLLAVYQARGVALDIFFAEPHPDGGQGDARLALLARHGPVVLAHAFEYHSVSADPVRGGVLGRGRPDPYGRQGIAASGYLANHAGLAEAAHIGNIGFIPDGDGVLRRIPLYTRFGGQQYPALSLALMQCCAGGKQVVPPPGEYMRIPYRRDWSAYDVVPATDILNLAMDPASIGGRLVVIGSSALGQGDRVTTPLAAQRPGLSVHAVMLSALLDQQAGLTPRPWPGRWIAFGYTVALAALLLWALPRRSALTSTFLLGAGALLWLAIAWWVTPHDPAYVTTAPLVAILFLLLVAVPYQWQLTHLRSRHLLSTLRQYVAREVVDELLRRGLQDPLRPVQRDVTTLIADMEGYTAQVAALPVSEAATLTRDFLECLTAPVIALGGTLDKYTGDGLVAFWGAPLPNPDHADLALDAARAVVARVEALSAARMRAGHPPLRVRIGIESGPAMAGDFGTSFRSIYTAVGDSVNTASRLEQAARDYPADVIIGAGTAERTRRHALRVLGERLLRGKERPTTLFTFDENQQGVPSLMSVPETSVRNPASSTE